MGEVLVVIGTIIGLSALVFIGYVIYIAVSVLFGKID